MGIWLVGLHGARAASINTPTGWGRGGTAEVQAQDRAEAWAKAWDAEVRDVLSTRSRDDFVETLAVLDVAGPLPAEVLDDPQAAREWLPPRVRAALGPDATLDELELIPRDRPGITLLQTRVVVGESIARVAFAPTGARHVVVVLLVPVAEEVLYTRVFEDAVDALEGLRPPVAPFARGTARLVAFGLWLAAGIVGGIVWTRRSLPLPGARVAGRQVATVLAIAAILIMLLMGAVLGGSAVELSLAGTSPWAMAFEIGAGGVVMAGLVLAGTELWARRLQPVASAPRAGSFAVTGATAKLRRPTEPAVGQLASQVLAQHGEDNPAPGPHSTPPGSTSEWPTPTPAGDTSQWPVPAVTGDTQVGPPPAVTGDTQVGPPPAVTGSTKIGPAPLPEHDVEAGPPIREVISGDFEVVNTKVSRRPQPSPADLAARPHSGLHDGAASLADPGDDPV